MCLDDRLYVLCKSNLPNDLQKRLVDADRLFLKDQDDKSEILIAEIEQECRVRGIKLYDDPF